MVLVMKANAKHTKSAGTVASLVPVAQNLKRHRVSGMYYGVKKVGGNIKRHALGTTIRKTADGLLAEWLNTLGRINPTNADLTLAGLVDTFRARRAKMADGTLVSEAGMCKSLLHHFSPAVLVGRIKPSEVDVWLVNATEGMRNVSINRWRQFARQLFAVAVDDRVIAESPFIETHHRAKKKQKVVRRIPSAEEFENILLSIRENKCNADREESADFAEFLGRAGLGQAEAAALKWGDIDVKRDVIHVRRQKTDEHFEFPIYRKLWPLLVRKSLEWNNGAYDPERRVFRLNEVGSGLSAACDRLNLPRFTQRNLRQMRICEMVRAGINPKLVAEWQGHRDGGILVMKVYTDVEGSGDEAWKRAELEKDGGKIVRFPIAA